MSKKSKYRTAKRGDVFVGKELSINAQKGAMRLKPYLERGAKGERFGTELLIGPDEAEFLLGSNVDNRSVGPTKIAQFVKDMRHGRWHSNGESVVVASTGELNDGQHRLLAVCESKVPVWLHVAFGYPRESRYTVDIGSARTTANHLQMAGVGYSSTVAATAKMLISYEQVGGRSLGRTGAVTSLETQERVKYDETLRDIVAYVEQHRAPFVRSSLVATAFYILTRIAPTEAKRYIDGILMGINLQATDPAYMVRNRLMRAKNAKSSSEKGNTYLTEQGTLEVILRAWNFYATGRTPNKIQVMGNLPVLERPTNPESVPASGSLSSEVQLDEVA